MHSSRLRLGPSQSRPLIDASPGSARSPGLRVCRAAPSRRRNIHTHAPFRTECQSFLRCRTMRLAISRKRRSGHAAALRRQRSQVRILWGAPLLNKRENFWRRFGGPFRRTSRQYGFRAADADLLVGDPDFVHEQPGVGLPELRRSFVEVYPGVARRPARPSLE